jgi:hypothetical protein
MDEELLINELMVFLEKRRVTDLLYLVADAVRQSALEGYDRHDCPILDPQKRDQAQKLLQVAARI